MISGAWDLRAGKRVGVNNDNTISGGSAGGVDTLGVINCVQAKTVDIGLVVDLHGAASGAWRAGGCGGGKFVCTDFKFELSGEFVAAVVALARRLCRSGQILRQDAALKQPVFVGVEVAFIKGGRGVASGVA